MPETLDPLETVMIEFGKFRAKVAQAAIALPTPDPVRQALREIDNQLAEVETSLEASARKASPLNALQNISGLRPGPFLRGKTFYAEDWLRRKQ